MDCWQKEELGPAFFTDFGTGFPKLAISSLITSGLAYGVTAIGVPVAAGAGIVLVAGIMSGLLIEVLDQRIGMTERMSKAAEIMWINLKKLNETSSNRDELGKQVDLLKGGPFQKRTQFEGQTPIYIV